MKLKYKNNRSRIAFFLALTAFMPLVSAQIGSLQGQLAQGTQMIATVGTGILYALILVVIGWGFWYRFMHNIPVEIIELRATGAGDIIGKRRKDIGGIFRKKKVPYLHLFWRFRIRNLREPLPHEKDFDGGVTVVKISDNFYAYAPKRLFLIKDMKQSGLDENKIHEVVRAENILMKPNPNFNPKKPADNPKNTRFVPVTEDSVEFSEAVSKQFIDESQKDSFRVDFRNILERFRPKDTSVVWVGLGLFAINAIIFILMLIFSSK